jgi:hypothetical protein
VLRLNTINPGIKAGIMNNLQPKTLVLKDLLRKPFPLIEDGAGNTFWIYLKKYFAKYW